MTCANCGRVNERNCVCAICGLVGCETCLDHSLPVYHVEHDNDRCTPHKETYPVPAAGSLTLGQVTDATAERIKDLKIYAFPTAEEVTSSVWERLKDKISAAIPSTDEVVKAVMGKRDLTEEERTQLIKEIAAAVVEKLKTEPLTGETP